MAYKTAEDGPTGISALTEIDEADRLLSAKPEHKTLFDHSAILVMPISTWAGMAAGKAVVDPSVLTTLPWAPFIWAAPPLVAVLAVGIRRSFARERRRRELEARIRLLVPAVVQGIRDGTVGRLTERQGSVLAALVGERTLREALQSSPAFRSPVEA